jgi:hypothetical protein
MPDKKDLRSLLRTRERAVVIFIRAHDKQIRPCANDTQSIGFALCSRAKTIKVQMVNILDSLEQECLVEMPDAPPDRL